MFFARFCGYEKSKDEVDGLLVDRVVVQGIAQGGENTQGRIQTTDAAMGQRDLVAYAGTAKSFSLKKNLEDGSPVKGRVSGSKHPGDLFQ